MNRNSEGNRPWVAPWTIDKTGTRNWGEASSFSLTWTSVYKIATSVKCPDVQGQPLTKNQKSSTKLKNVNKKPATQGQSQSPVQYRPKNDDDVWTPIQAPAYAQFIAGEWIIEGKTKIASKPFILQRSGNRVRNGIKTYEVYDNFG